MNLKKSRPRPEAVKSNLNCPLCGKSNIKTVLTPYTFDYGSGDTVAELSVEIPVRRCDACDIDFLDHEGERIKHEAICQHFGVLTPNEIRLIRTKCSDTRTKFSEVTGLGAASLNRWENGLSIQNHANDRYLRLLKDPAIMRRLETIVNSELNLQSGKSNKDQFRAIVITSQLWERRKEFQLRRAA